MRQLVYQVCYTKYHVSFYLWLIGSALKHCKVPKYYDQDCKFHVPSSNTSSITIPLSPSVPLHPSSPRRCKSSNNQYSEGTSSIPITTNRSYNHLAILTHHHHNNIHNIIREVYFFSPLQQKRHYIQQFCVLHS